MLHVQTRAELLARQGALAPALAANAEALALAEPAGIHEIVFKAQLLAIRLGDALGQMPRPAAVAALQALLAPCDSPPEQGAIYYELAQLAPAAPAARQTAADLYQQLYSQTFQAEYRERYEALTGARLPDPPPLPPLPALVTRDPVDLGCAPGAGRGDFASQSPRRRRSADRPPC